MSIIDYMRGRDIEYDVRTILMSRGVRDCSTAACKRWTGEFIRGLIPRWRPGAVLSWQEAQIVGEAFEAECKKAGKPQHKGRSYRGRYK